MSAITLCPALEVSAAELHAAFAEAFADYLIGPFQLGLAHWPGFLERQGAELVLSRVALRGKQVLAFALVAPRPEIGRWRLATMGAVPAARGSGAAPALLDELIARAAAAGVVALELEVFAQNERAVRLYRGRGFEPWHALHGYERPAGIGNPGVPALSEVDLDCAYAWLSKDMPPDLPLQVLSASLAGLGVPLTAWQRGSAQIVFATAADGAIVVYSLVDRDPAQDSARALVQALVARHGAATIKVPALQRLDVGGQAFRDAGFQPQPLHQLMMLKRLQD